MPKVRLFFDSSALFAGIASSSGAGRALLLLGEAGQIDLVVSEQVIIETERAIARKVPRALSDARQAILNSRLSIVPDPPVESVLENMDWISHAPDVPVVIAASLSGVDYLVTLNRKHFAEYKPFRNDDPQVALRSALRIGTPGDALAWVRSRLAAE